MLHGHGTTGRAENRKRLAFALVLAATYTLAELIGGLLTNSLALLADAGHMLSDVAALGLSLFAAWIADRPSPSHRTYGYYRAEILTALVNGAALVAVSFFIFVEAWHRLRDPPEVIGSAMMAVAIGGLLVNLVALRVLHAGRKHSLNVRGAWLHVLSDTLGSVGAITGGALIWAYGWRWADPVASIIIGILVIYSAWRLLGESVSVLMESAPRRIDVDEVFTAMRETEGVQEVHDLHVWTITTGMDALSAHIVAHPGEQHGALLGRLRGMLRDRFGIDHLTIQIEPEDFEEGENPV